jgi:hypothetical protein
LSDGGWLVHVYHFWPEGDEIDFGRTSNEPVTEVNFGTDLFSLQSLVNTKKQKSHIQLTVECK